MFLSVLCLLKGSGLEKTYATSGELLGAAVLVTTKGVADILVSAEDVEQTCCFVSLLVCKWIRHLLSLPVVVEGLMQ